MSNKQLFVENFVVIFRKKLLFLFLYNSNNKLGNNFEKKNVDIFLYISFQSLISLIQEDIKKQFIRIILHSVVFLFSSGRNRHVKQLCII